MSSKSRQLPVWITSHQIAVFIVHKLLDHMWSLLCNWTPILDWYMAKIVLWMTQKLTYVCNEIGVCAQNMDTILGSIVNTIGCLMGPGNGKEIPFWNSKSPSLCFLHLLSMQDNSRHDPTPHIKVELEVPTIGPRTLQWWAQLLLLIQYNEGILAKLC